MAGAMTMVKSRTAPTEEAISFPVLTYSDASPRNDLQDVDTRIKNQQSQQNQQSLAQFEFPRPTTADERSGRKPPPGTVATFDFRVTAPPDEAVPSQATMDRSPMGVGIALGSPGMANSTENFPPPRFDTSIFTEKRKEQTLPRKASKWKKIGGLFRAKSALASPTRPRPNLPHLKTDIAAGSTKHTTHKSATEEWPRIEVSPENSTSKGVSTHSRTRKFSISNKNSNLKPMPAKQGQAENGLGPRLDVNIPDVQMERYSVMFSNVMNKNQRPSLLARRSKTLDSLHVPENSEFLAAKIPPVPQRRATSPARSSFTLFPTSQPSKAAEVLGTQNFSRGPSPLLRSKTLPVESPSSASPMTLPRAIPNNNSVSSFDSMPIGKVFSSHTPRSSTASSRYDDKPLPAIKHEPESEPEKVVQNQKPAPKPSNLRQSPIPTSKSELSLRQRSSPLKNESSAQPHQQQKQEQQQKQQQQQQPQHHQEKPRPTRPILTVKTASTPLPQPQTKELPVRSSSIPVPGKQLPGQQHIPKVFTDQSSMTLSPAPLSSGPLSASASPRQSPRALRASPGTFSPGAFATQVKPGPGSGSGSGTGPGEKKMPTIEVSTARSVSVSKGKRQMLVPIGARAEHFDANERLVERKTLMPKITEVSYGHRPAKSQELQIESL